MLFAKNTRESLGHGDIGEVGGVCAPTVHDPDPRCPNGPELCRVVGELGFCGSPSRESSGGRVEQQSAILRAPQGCEDRVMTHLQNPYNRDNQ